MEGIVYKGSLKRYRWKSLEKAPKLQNCVITHYGCRRPTECIERLHYGSDGHIRVVDLRTQGGKLTRSLVNLCFLPTAYNYENASNELFTDTTATQIK